MSVMNKTIWTVEAKDIQVNDVIDINGYECKVTATNVLANGFISLDVFVNDRIGYFCHELPYAPNFKFLVIK